MPLYIYDREATTDYFDLTTTTYLLLMAQADFNEPLIKLPGYSLDQPDIELSSPITVARYVRQRGKYRVRQKTVEGARPQSYSFPVGFPEGNWLRSRIANLARSDIERDFFLLGQCLADPKYAHFWRLPEGNVDPIQPGQMLSLGDDGAAITATSNIHVDEPYVYFAKGFSVPQDLTPPLYAVSFILEECEDVDVDLPSPHAVLGGGNGTDTPVVSTTEDQFGTVTDTAPAVGILPATHVVTGSWSHGSAVVQTHVDDVATPTTGGVMVSKDEGATWIAGINTATGSALADVLLAVTYGNGRWVAVGASGAIYRSVDGVYWTALANTVSSGDFGAIAYDPSNGRFYVAGIDGTDGVALIIDGTAITDISTVVGGGSAPDELTAVAVLEVDHVMFGALDGTLYENQKASGSANYTVVVSNTTDPVKAILGDAWCTLIGAGTGIFERSLLTNREFVAMSGVAGAVLTGDIQGGSTGSIEEDLFLGFNYFAFVTDDGEVAMVKPLTD